jgi:ADP-ribosylglycohydrolase
MELIEDILCAPFVWAPEPATEPTAPAPAPAPAPAQDPAERRDRIGGMLLGAALGDALGSPHEFGYVPLEQYTGELEHPVIVNRRFQGGRLRGNVASVSDDTEMAIALADAVVDAWARHGRYDQSTAIAEYLAWANSKCPFLGRNTRALFVGVRTERGYLARWTALRSGPATAWSASNGCLMRCAPLAALPDAGWAAAAKQDCALTNFHPTCVASVCAYLTAARALLTGASPSEATAAALGAAAAAPEVAAVIAAARDQAPRDVLESKGWVLHALHCAFLALNDDRPTYQARIDRVVRLGGDADTNAAIAGALLGAQLGEAALRAEPRTGPNLARMLANDPSAGALPRPARYAASRLPALADQLAALA